MTKGTWSKGKRNTKSHGLCPRCGRRAFHNRKKTCAACGYPSAKTRKFNWCTKASRRKKTGTGRMRYLGRALKRRSNRRQFNSLSPILKKAITDASNETNKRMPTKRSIQKHLRRQKNKISQRRSDRKKFIDSLEDEVTKRLQVSDAK
mmetsp:Transcript_29713/g.26278  ORF Transcript_29713/g.26278 Transcript_29713/m.26278 type:complete len:148 (-) Transcript_29713:27-470(-)